MESGVDCQLCLGRSFELYNVTLVLVGAHLCVRPGALNQTLCFLSTIGREINVGAEGDREEIPLSGEMSKSTKGLPTGYGRPYNYV